MEPDERRVNARIEADLVCRLATDDSSTEARIRDLSRGGALIIASRGFAEVGASMTIEIELPDGVQPITVLGEVVRTEARSELTGYGVRFSIVEPRQRDDLNRFIDSLLTRKGVGSRQHPRVHRRVLVKCRTADQFQAMMNNISRGGISLSSDVALALEEAVTVEVLAAPDLKPVELQATVMHVRKAGPEQYHVGVRFNPLSAEQEEALKAHIQRLMVGSATT